MFCSGRRVVSQGIRTHEAAHTPLPADLPAVGAATNECDQNGSLDVRRRLPSIAGDMQLLERDDARATLAKHLADARAGAGRLVFVAGEAGIGKTSLVRDFIESADVPTAWGYCDSLFTPRPFGPIHDLARLLGPEVAAALESGERESIFRSVLQTLDAHERVIVLEDVHWADEPTLDLIVFLARRLHGKQTLVLATYRDDEVSPTHPLRIALGRLTTTPPVRHLEVQPLSVSAVATLVGGAGFDAEEVHRQTAGNPFLVTQMVETPRDAVPRGIGDATLARLAPLTEAARNALCAASICGDRTGVEILSQVAQTDETIFAEIMASGMARIEEGTLVFRHELVRRALERLVEASKTRDVHRSVIAALEGRPDRVDPARLAYHAERAGDAERLIRYADEAALAAASVGGHREAAAQYARVLRFPSPLSAEQRAAYLERRSYECYLSGDLREALDTEVAALAAWRSVDDRVRAGDCLRAVSLLEWYVGDRDRADGAADEAIAALEGLPAGRALAMAYSNRSRLHMLQGNNSAAIAWGERAIALAERLDEPEVLVHALNNLGSAQTAVGNHGGIETLSRSLDLAKRLATGEHIARAYVNLARGAIYAADYPGARQHLDDCFAYCSERDLDAFELYGEALRARLLLEQCEWDAALEAAGRLLAHRHVEGATIRSLAATVAGLVAARRSQASTELLDEALRLAGPRGDPDRIAYVLAARAEAAWLQGQVEKALDQARQAYATARRGGSLSIVGMCAVWLSRMGSGAAAPRGAIEPVRLELEGRLEDAAVAWSDLGCRYDAALCRGRSTDPQAAREGAETLLALGATAAISALNRLRRLRKLGLLPKGPRRATRENPAGLTARELEILDLLSEGLRNADIATKLVVSEKTVDHHVSAVLRKLGVRSRAAAVARVRSPRQADE